MASEAVGCSFDRQEPEGSERIAEAEPGAREEVPLELDAERIVARDQGREGWLREGKR